MTNLTDQQAIKRGVELVLLLLLAGCEHIQPVISYQHQSDPTIANDGYDLACVGVEAGERLLVRGDVCENFSRIDTTPVRVTVEYRPGGRKE